MSENRCLGPGTSQGLRGVRECGRRVRSVAKSSPELSEFDGDAIEIPNRRPHLHPVLGGEGRKDWSPAADGFGEREWTRCGVVQGKGPKGRGGGCCKVQTGSVEIGGRLEGYVIWFLNLFGAFLLNFDWTEIMEILQKNYQNTAPSKSRHFFKTTNHCIYCGSRRWGALMLTVWPTTGAT